MILHFIGGPRDGDRSDQSVSYPGQLLKFAEYKPLGIQLSFSDVRFHSYRVFTKSARAVYQPEMTE